MMLFSIPYLRFDVSDLKADDLLEATRSLQFVSTKSSDVQIYALNDGLAGETTWSSANLTWDTRPDGTGTVPNTNLHHDDRTLKGAIKKVAMLGSREPIAWKHTAAGLPTR